jgi:ATP-dependent Clp protease ATP-binding subunit ClpA
MFSRQLELSLVMAIREAKNHHHEYVTIEHILYGLLHDELANRRKGSRISLPANCRP